MYIILIMRKKEFDALLLLGLRLKKGCEPEEELILRVKKAAEAFKTGKYPVMIVCGGRFSEEEKTEAEVMEALLTEEGISPGCIVREDQSKVTLENVENAAKLIGKKRPFVCVVTSDYHTRRARLLCRLNGMKAVSIGAHTPENEEKRAKKRLEFLYMLDAVLQKLRRGKKRGRLTLFFGRIFTASSYKTLGREAPKELKKKS